MRDVLGNIAPLEPTELAANPAGLETLAARLENISYTVFGREDGQFQIGHHDDAPCFPTRAFALRVASGHPPEPARVPARNFRRIKIREVRGNAPA